MGRLILLEGLCGAGKSTLGARLHRHCAERGLPAAFFDEGAWPHPVGLNGHAFFRPMDYARLFSVFPGDAQWIRAHTISEADFSLVAYGELERVPEKHPLYAYLRERELCYTQTPVATAAEYAKALQSSWRRFARRVAARDETVILDGIFFQHPVHDFLRNYAAQIGGLNAHIRACAEAIAPLNPVLIYLDRPDVGGHLEWIGGVRGKPHYTGKARVQFMQRRYEIERGLRGALPFAVCAVENENNDWDAAFAQILRTLCFPPISASEESAANGS